MRLAILILAAAAAFAEEATSTKKTPEIPPAIEAKFWRAQTQFMAILPDFQAKEAAVKQVRAELDAVCGKQFVLADDNGLKCVPKPAPPKEQPKK